MKYNDFADEAEDVRHSPAERSAAASRSTWVSVVVNVLLSTAQIVVGVFSKSQALIADGIHSLSDLVSQSPIAISAIAGSAVAVTSIGSVVSVAKTMFLS